MQVRDLIKHYPRLYHMAEFGTWPSIRAHGLLSTSAVLDKFNIRGQQRRQLRSTYRPEKVAVGTRPEQIVLRDQKPMETRRLESALINGVTASQWYETINDKVFFWVEEHRLQGLLNARQYKGLEHDVLTVDTASFVGAHEGEIWLCHMNSGSTYRFATPRDMTTFKRISDYPASSTGRPVKKVVELVVDYKVLDIAAHVIEVRRMKADEVLEHLPLG